LTLGKLTGKSPGNRLLIYLLICMVDCLVYLDIGSVDGSMVACLTKVRSRLASPPKAIIRPNAAVAMSD